MVSGLFLSPLPDLGAGVIMALLGLAIGGAVLLFLGIAFLEGVILMYMDWPSILTALLDSFLANLATTILGVLVWWFTSSVFYDDIFLSPGMWFVMWGVSMAIEGGLLQLIRRQPAQKTWTAAFIMNIVSYAGLYRLYTFGS